MKKYDYLIVGQGLAGSLLAHEMEKANISYQIIDTGVNHSSAVAAGIINPIVFRRTAKSWMVDTCYPVAIEAYQALEEKLATSFFFERVVQRSFSSEQERDEWGKKEKWDAFMPYIGRAEQVPTYLNTPFGSGLVHQAHYVDSAAFMAANRRYFEKEKRLIIGKLDYATVSEKGCVIGEKQFERIVFCEGYQGVENPFFNHLPLTQTKGQLLSFAPNKQLDKKEILNRKCFLLPLEDGTFKAGSTYEWNDASLTTTEAAYNEISGHLTHLLSIPLTSIGQESGIRPTVTDRRPLIGQHDSLSNLFIVNGLGAKGFLLAPYFVQQFLCFAEKNLALNSEVSIARFKK